MSIANIYFFPGVVGQEPVLFHGTIFENIAIACPEATLPEVQRVAAMAYAHEFITNLPKVCSQVIIIAKVIVVVFSNFHSLELSNDKLLPGL